MILKLLVSQLILLFFVTNAKKSFVTHNNEELWKKCTKIEGKVDSCTWDVDGCFFPNKKDERKADNNFGFVLK